MKYPFEFNECLLTDELLTFMGFTPYHDCAGDFGKRSLKFGNSFYTIYDMDEKKDDADGYGYHPTQYQPSHFTNGNFMVIYFLHEIYEDILSEEIEGVNKEDIEIFEEICKKCNLKPFIDSYKNYLNGKN